MVTDAGYENLKSFLDRIKNITFFERIFKWGAIMKLFIIALSEFDRFSMHANNQAIKISELQSDARLLANKFDNLESKYNADHDELIELKAKQTSLIRELSDKQADLSGRVSTISALNAEKEKLIAEHISLNQRYESLMQNFDEVKSERNKLSQAEEARISAHEQKMKKLKLKEKMLQILFIKRKFKN